MSKAKIDMMEQEQDKNEKTKNSELKERPVRRKKRSAIKRIVLFLIAAIFAISFLLPTVLTFANSFMSEQEISSNYGVIFNDYTSDPDGKDRTVTYRTKTVNLKLIPDKVVGTQYETVLLKSPDYLMKFWNSVLLKVPIMIFQILIALGAAYSFARFRGRIKELIFFLYLVLMLMPYQVTLVPNYIVNSWLGLLDTRWSIIFPGIFAPFSVYLLTKYMRRIPESVIEAAKLDGANEWKIFWHIALPLCKGPIASVAILVFIDYLNMVEQPLIMMSNSAFHPLSIFLSQINNGEIGKAFTYANRKLLKTIPDGTTEVEAQAIVSDLDDAQWLHRGNIYGAGSGIGKYKYDFTYDKDTDDNGQDADHTATYRGKSIKEEDYSTSAGSVTRFTKVEINGGTIHRNVYGGGSLASVGPPTIPPTRTDMADKKGAPTGNHGSGWQSLCEVIIKSMIGSPTNYQVFYGGEVFGASRGNAELGESFANVVWTLVNIINGANIKGNVYGGGDNGIVKMDTDVQIGGDSE